jgi:hypothetical protein
MHKKYYTTLLYALLLAFPLLAALPSNRVCNNTQKCHVKSTKTLKPVKAHHPLDFLMK